MAFPGSQIAYRYTSNQRDDRFIADGCILDHYDNHAPVSHGYDLPTSSFIPMRRFIDEQERPLFLAETLPSFHSLDLAPDAYATSTVWPYNMDPGLQSPSLSGPSSSYFSSSASDRQSTPLSPPEPGFATWSPEFVHTDHFGLPFGGGHELHSEHQKHSVSYPCVALHDVQSYEDPQPEKLAYEDDTPYYGSYASATHEGYQPVEPYTDVADSGVETDDNDSKDDDYTPQSPNLRRRRPQPTRAITSPHAPSKVIKRSGHVRRSSAPQSRPVVNSSGGSNSTSTPNRAFPCALANYGCEATFGSKNEWKRHVNTQHMRLGYWRCDQCEDNKRKPNDFNRKDLYIQHVRRMHPVQATPTAKTAPKQCAKPVRGNAEDQALNALAERCFRQDRLPPGHSGCHFCDATFDCAGEPSQSLWDKRLEHVAQHMEGAKKNEAGPADPSSWRVDARLERWLLENRIITKTSGGGFALG